MSKYTPHINALRNKIEQIQIAKIQMGIATDEEKEAMRRIIQMRYDTINGMFNYNMKKKFPYGTVGISPETISKEGKKTLAECIANYAYFMTTGKEMQGYE